MSNSQGKIVSEYNLYTSDITDAEKGKLLVELARKYGFSDRESIIPGATLRKWVKGKVPVWALKTMLKYIISLGYQASEDEAKILE